MFSAVRTDIRTFRTAVTAVTDKFHTVAAVAAIGTPAVITYTFLAGIAVSTEVIVAVIAVLATLRADHRALRTAVAVIANGIHAVDAGLAVQTEIALAARTVNTPITAFADLILGTVGALLHTVLADFGAVIAARTTVADVIAAAADTAVFTPAVITYAAPAVAAVGTDIARTV